MVWDGPGDMELVRQVHEEELEPALQHLLIVAGLAGVQQLPALVGQGVSLEILRGGSQVPLFCFYVVFCLRALIFTTLTCLPLTHLSLDSMVHSGITTVPSLGKILSVIFQFRSWSHHSSTQPRQAGHFRWLWLRNQNAGFNKVAARPDSG